jgi:hypothetical protein
MSLGWTRADQAELDIILWEFLDALYLHRDLCAACYRLNRWCRPLDDAWTAVEVWLYRRRLLSKAQWLRDEETLTRG